MNVEILLTTGMIHLPKNGNSYWGSVMLVLHILMSTNFLCVYVTMFIRVVVEKKSVVRRT